MARRRWSKAEEDRIIGLVKMCQDIQQLKQIHAQLFVKGQSQNNFLLTKLVRSATALGNLEQARSLFNGIESPGVFLWTAMIRGYSQQDDCRLCKEALMLYAHMHNCGLSTKGQTSLTFTLSSVLKACIRLSKSDTSELALAHGMQIHAHIIKYGFQSETRILTTLICLYSWCKCTKEMQQLFDRMPESQRDIQAWNTIIAGHARHGNMEAALSLFQLMPEQNLHTWVEMITGYANGGQMDRAQELFDTLKVSSMFADDRNRTADAVVSTAMITGYSKCRDIASARLVFDTMTQRDVASWNAMIAAYSHAGLFDEALDLFHLMLKGPRGVATQVVCPNETTMATVISACAQFGSTDLAQRIEDYVDSRRCDLLNRHTATALIEMHSKCGNLEKAYKVFQRWKSRDVIYYSAMIEGFGIHGQGMEALRIFSQLLEEGLQPDGICFIAVLSACSHSGLVDEGYSYFKSMRDEFKISPTADHYMCMVDLLGRAGHINEAYRLITDVMPPVKPHAGVWGALLSACRTHSNVELGEVAAQQLLDIEPDNAGNYMLLSNIYAKDRRWEDVGKVRALMRRHRMRKLPGCSWIQVGNSTQKFFTGDIWDQKLWETLELFGEELKDRGYLLCRENREDID
eukprot:TRINITY_DN10361_c1_g1_i1.p1 TRINITY_DN10361_c1_g1~~TRINITY_DN10361_c1_g1_i1.p1  ORF type:complete len:631 (+),score=110.07 TRINITY_DN10361_c1_g1_i1:410-2302(+)